MTVGIERNFFKPFKSVLYVFTPAKMLCPSKFQTFGVTGVLVLLSGPVFLKKSLRFSSL